MNEVPRPYQPGQRVYVNGTIDLDSGVSPNQIGCVLEDLGDIIYVHLDEIVEIEGQEIRQWTDREQADQDICEEYVRPIVNEDGTPLIDPHPMNPRRL